MEARSWTGDDDRDELQADVTRCPDCGALDMEYCDPDCECEYCTAAGRAQAGPQKGAA